MLKESLIGKTYGFLKVIDFDGYNHHPRRKYPCWKCECVCGKIVRKETSVLKKSNSNASCGCKRFKEVPDKDLTGLTFGKLYVKDFAGYKFYGKNKVKRAYYIVKCSCGSAEYSILGTHLTRKNGSSKSCGCLQKENFKIAVNNIKNKISDYEAGLLHLYSVYKNRAVQRNYDFTLTLEEFSNITSSNCVYCNKSPSMKIKSKGRLDYYFYNGVDRTNNFKGYTIDNVKPCCKTCNYAKKDLTEESFKEWLDGLVEYQNFLKMN